MTRLLHETVAYADTAAFLAAVAAGTTPWSPASVVTGLTVDPTVPYAGHASLKYDGVTPSRLDHALRAGYRRVWVRCAVKLSSTLYSAGEPPVGEGPLPFQVQALAFPWTLTSGLWRRTASNAYAPTAHATDGSTTLAGESADGLSLAQVQSLDWFTWDALIEQWDAQVRMRGWRDGVLALDQRLSTGALAHQTTLRLAVDALLPHANNALWLGEVEVWDAERDPDPYDVGLVWADSASDALAVGCKHKYELGPSYPLYAADETSPTGMGHYEIFKGAWGPDATWAGKLVTGEVNLAFGARVRPTIHDLDTPIFNVGGAVWPFGDPTNNSWVETASVGVDPAGQVWASVGGVIVGRSTATIPFGTNVPFPGTTTPAWGAVQEEYRWLYAEFHAGAGDGWIRVLLETGDNVVEEILLVEGLTFDPAGAWAFGMPSEVYGSPEAYYQYDLADLVVTRGLEHRLARVDVVSPNGDGQDHDWTFSTGTDRDGQVPGADYWYRVFERFGVEPDDDWTMIASGSLGGRASLQLSPLPDPDCGGLVSGLVPQGQLHSTSVLVSTVQPYWVVGGTRYDLELVSSVTTTWPTDRPYPFVPDAGVDGWSSYHLGAMGRNPATGDSWGDVPADLELGLAGAHLECSLVVVHAVRVHPSNDAPTGSELAGQKYGDWRAGPPQGMKYGAWRVGQRAWGRRNGEWREIPLGVTPMEPYCPAGRQPEPLIDPFAGRLNTRLWAIEFWDPAPTPSPPSQVSPLADRIQMSGPGASDSTRDLRAGIVTQSRYDWTGGSAQVECVKVADLEASRGPYLTVGLVPGSDWSIRVDGLSRVWRVVENLGTSGPTRFSMGYDPVAHRWWRIAHDAVATTLEFWTSPDGATWTLRYTSPGSKRPVVFFALGVSNWFATSPITNPASTVEFAHFSTSAVRHW